MAELQDICAAARGSASRGQPLWLATVMRVRGSAYRHAGARLLFTHGQALAGSVSGGCLEASIVKKGPWLTREHPACICFEGSRDEDDDSAPRGTGCDGTVDILVERVLDVPARSLDPLVFIDECLASERRGIIVTIFESSNPSLPLGARLVLRKDGELASTIRSDAVSSELVHAARCALREQDTKCRHVRGRDFEALLEIIEPAPHLFLFGSGPDAVPVAEFAGALGLGVTVCDTTARVAARERFAGLAKLHVGSVASAMPLVAARRTPLAVVMSHHYPTDASALELLLASRARYVGVLGPARRTARMLSELSPGSSARLLRDPRLHAPIGLDLGAETPAQIALSIVAEIQAVLAQASAEPLSRRGRRPIHVPSSELTVASAEPWARTGST